ncbi:FMN-linked oxidoreductase [Trichocladium antarcticum]|uniref:FMN-linked oxidoreductase n=1 Tax=Trichocladium antarcticum TaxID=1450529 RepID=A0AAN6UF93_9PEZI|nr:FMN-linked oxidoreductase [Trichocladium antarcticum]
MAKVFSAEEVARHTSPESCWVVLHGNVYDVTEFLPEHPGGSRIILQLAGRDATPEYDPIHPPGTLEENLKPSAKLGTVDPASLKTLQRADAAGQPEDEARAAAPPLHTLLNLDEMEAAAKTQVSKKCWAYYFSAADDLASKSYNNTVYRHILLRPRVLVDCTATSTATTLLGQRVATPLYVAPAAMARLAHPDGEAGIARGVARFGAMQLVSHSASMSPEQIVAGAAADAVFGWQLPDSNSGIGQQMFWGTAADLTWQTTLPWLARHTSLPIVLKGIQTHEDAYLAAQYARKNPGTVRAIILSNHGGRSLDTAPPAVHTLLEIRKYCPEVFTTIEVWVDGGIKRGTDVVKALCLGAKAVGVGRAALFGLGAGGWKGVERTFEILQGEIVTCMKMLGAKDLSELGPRFINTRMVERDIFDGGAGLDTSGLWTSRAKL